MINVDVTQKNMIVVVRKQGMTLFSGNYIIACSMLVYTFFLLGRPVIIFIRNYKKHRSFLSFNGKSINLNTKKSLKNNDYSYIFRTAEKGCDSEYDCMK